MCLRLLIRSYKDGDAFCTHEKLFLIAPQYTVFDQLKCNLIKIGIKFF